MELNERDTSFLVKASESVVDPIFPGLLEGILRLELEGVGRAIVVEKPGDAGNLIRREIGYVLPLNRDQSKHLVFLIDGNICITEASSPKDRDMYLGLMSPNKKPLKFPASVPIEEMTYTTIDGSSWLKSKVLLRNDKEDSVDEINKAVEEAIRCSFELRDSRKAEAESSIAQTATNLVYVLDIIFTSDDDTEESEDQAGN